MTDLSEAILVGIQTAMRNAHVCLPGRVTAYDLAHKAADVELQLRRGIPRTDGLGLASEAFPLLRNVPVHQPAAGGFFVHFPVKPGDFVWVHFSDMTIDRYRSKGAVTDPGDHRMHALGNAFCVPMYDPAEARMPSDGHADNLVIGKVGGSQIHVKPSGDISLGSESPASKVALATKVADQLTALKNAISSAAVGSADGGAVLKSNIMLALAAWPASVASSKVSAD